MPEEFIERGLAGARFHRVDLAGATFEDVNLAGALFHDVDMRDARIRGAFLRNVEITGEVEGLHVNGMEVWPLVEAELDRRHPERAKLRPTDAAGFREAWAVIEELWADTVERAKELDPSLLHEHVERRVVVHRDLATPRVCNRCMGQAGTAR